MELRQYQKDAIAAVADNLQLGVRHQLLVLATGTGKTVIAAQLPSIIKGKLLLQACLGSDRVRELLGYVQMKNGDAHPTLFLESKADTKLLTE